MQISRIKETAIDVAGGDEPEHPATAGRPRMKADRTTPRGLRRALRLVAAGLVLAVAVTVGSKGGRAADIATSPAPICNPQESMGRWDCPQSPGSLWEQGRETAFKCASRGIDAGSGSFGTYEAPQKGRAASNGRCQRRLIAERHLSPMRSARPNGVSPFSGHLLS